MRKLALLGLLVAGCGSGGEGSVASAIVGRWEYANAAGTLAVGLRLDGASSYQTDILFITSANSANDERETGTYSASGGELTFMPSTSTCADLSPSTVPYRMNGDELVLTLPTGEIGMVRIEPSAPEPYTFAFGCEVNGSWVPQQ